MQALMQAAKEKWMQSMLTRADALVSLTAASATHAAIKRERAPRKATRCPCIQHLCHMVNMY